MKFQKLDKKSLIYLSIVILASLILLFLSWYFSQMPEIKEEIRLPEKPSQEQISQQQLEELEKLRSETATLTEKEIQTQLKDLEALGKKQKPFSQEQIQKQIEELNKLRSQ